jgi:hypothetical protein
MTEEELTKEESRWFHIVGLCLQVVIIVVLVWK